ncbi:chromosome segregation protein SMC [candidate division WOR-3 bacterium]|nr:chromosome segregation protein SMC [candidate division WOR-3 bacterium]
MRLKRIDIFGFKSFADRVSMDFDDGITGIVGPNGCGKSNLIEAIRWALGEQNSRLIRAVKMEEVIFNGTTERPPLGFTEIDLTFESKGESSSPLGFHEITFRRRVKRDGVSEYFINQTPCLLRDVIDTLRNIGITSRSYSLFSLDAIKRILDDDSQVRRDMFAEVSGIAKYQAQKNVTISRLRDTEADIMRLQDKIEEVNTNLDMLKKDLRKTNQYKNLKTKYEARLLCFSKKKRDEIIGVESRLTEDIQKNQIRRTQMEEEAKNFSVEIDSLWSQEQNLGKDLSEKQEKLDEHLSVFSKISAEIAETRQRIKYLDEKILEHEEELKGIEISIPSLENESAQMERDFGGFLTDENLKQKERSNLIGSLEKERAVIDSLTDKISMEYKNRDDKDRQDINLQNEITALSEKRTLKTDLLRSLKETQVNRKIEKDEYTEKLMTIEESVKKLYYEQNAIEGTLSDLREKSSLLNSKRESLQTLMSSLEKDLASCDSELSLLTNQQRDLEGYDEATKYLLKKYGYRTLGDLVEVEKGHELAVEIVLGSALGAVIVQENQLKKMAEEIKIEEKGKAWFLVKVENEQEGEIVFPQGLDPLSSHVKVRDESLNLIVKRILDDWFVVRDGEDMLEISKKHPSLCAVDKDGRFTIKGALYSMGAQSLKIIGRKERIEELKAVKETLKEKIGSAEEEKLVNDRNLDDVIQELGDKTQTLKMIVDKKGTLQTEIQNLNYKIGLVEETDREETEEFKELERELGEIEASLGEKNRQSAKIAIERENILSSIDSLNSELQEARKKIEPSLAQISEIEKQTAVLSERKKTISERLSEKKLQVEKALDRAEQLGKMTAQEREMVKKLQFETVSMEEKKSEYAAILENSKREIEFIQSSIEEIRQKNRKTEEESRILEKSKTELMDVSQELRVKMADLRGELNNIAKELETAFGFGLEKLDEVEPNDEEVTQEDIIRIKSRLLAMGSVNENAEQEYSEILERFNFLRTQRDDLESTKKGLKETINSIDKVAREKFLETFEAVRINFKNIFSILFKSSSEENNDNFLADLELEEDKDPLESDIRVIAVPPGKKLSTTRLLSTGEQSFTALSLLYALHQMRLSPLVVLDEVDAPLDDSNVEIFIRFLKTIALESQVILVTHNRRTMEFCQALYGITMEEKGVSSIVSVNLEKIDEFLGEDN